METSNFYYCCGLTFRQALMAPEFRSIHIIFFIITMIFVWNPTPAVIAILALYWAVDFGMVWMKWKFDNRPRNPDMLKPPHRNPAPLYQTPEENDPAEVAYWNFDARRKGLAEWNGRPMSERDAFKAEYRAAIADYWE